MPRGVNDFDTARIQGRNRSDANTVNVVSPPFITDGLIQYFDAGNTYSYPLSGSTWFDLTTNRRNATLQNGAAYSLEGTGAIRTANTIGRIEAPNTLVSRNCSICFWLKKATASAGGGGATPFSLRTAGGPKIQINFGTNDYYWYGGGGFVNGTFIFTQGGGTTSFDFVVLSFDSTNATSYRNGVQVSQTASSDFAVSPTNMYLGSDVAQGYWDGFFANFFVYNRPLGAQEVLQLFNATRARFNV
jgi:Concanavalin A-like lectin/glucanases superfamily